MSLVSVLIPTSVLAQPRRNFNPPAIIPIFEYNVAEIARVGRLRLSVMNPKVRAKELEVTYNLALPMCEQAATEYSKRAVPPGVKPEDRKRYSFRHLSMPKKRWPSPALIQTRESVVKHPRGGPGYLIVYFYRCNGIWYRNDLGENN